MNITEIGSHVTRRGALALLVLCVGFLLSATAARAASFTVNSTNDTNDGSCTTTKCSLRDAIVAADTAGGSSTITLPAGTYKLSIASTGTNDPTTGDLDVDNDATITITGAGAATTTINAAYVDRAFAVQEGASLSISGVTIEHGQQPSSSVSSTYPASHSTAPGEGGAFYNDGSLTISASVLTANSSENGGGVIYSDSHATTTSVSNSVLNSNVSQDNNGGAISVLAGALTLSGDAIENNWDFDDGGAVYDDESGDTAGAVTITDTTFSGNGSDDPGGALYLQDAGAASISGSSFSDNNANDDEGGAIYADSSGAITLSDSSFTDNSSGGSESGGAIYTDGTDLTISSSQFTGNAASEDGGAIYLKGTSNTASESITSSSFTGNAAGDDEGGAIYDDEGALTITGSTMSQNLAYYGGAIYYDSNDALTLTNDTLDSNQAEDGGGLYFDAAASSGSIALLNDTIAHNTGWEGGGIFGTQQTNSIENTIVADNTGQASAGPGGGDCYEAAGTADKGNNIDSDGTCFGGDSSSLNDQTSVDPLLGPLSDNGGPTETDALLTGSPAIGKANGSACPTTDQRGVARSSTACDVGAYQTGPTDLGITVTGTATARVGGLVTDRFTLTNGGANPATGVTFTDTLPSGVSYFAASSSQGTCSGTTTVTCNLGSIDSSKTGTVTAATVTITFVPGSAGSVVNKGTVATTETNTGTSSASATTTVSVATTTLFVAPVVLTGTASEIKSGQATVSALINPAGEATSYVFQYGTSGKFGKSTKTGTIAAGVGRHGVTAVIKGLKAGTTYHFRIVARNASGTSDGSGVTFKTKKASKKKATRRA
jgi:uncharacterized repeat protein (TIGR01451 family)/CSLREA domain-containing protein